MRLVEKLVVEAIKEAEIVRVQFAALKGCDALRDFTALLAHTVRLTGPFPKHKPAPSSEEIPHITGSHRPWLAQIATGSDTPAAHL